MSHFAVLVIGEDYDYQLAPFHEYEYTGQLDEFVQYVAEDIDKQKEIYEKYAQEYNSFAEFLKDEGFSLYNGGEIPLNNYFTTDANGEVQGIFRFTNPNAKWDWYVLGGRWNGFFKLKPDTPENKEFVGEPGVFGNSREDYSHRSDHTQKKYVDVEFMVNEAKEESEKVFDQVIEAVGEYPLPDIKTWEEVASGEYSKEKREEYFNQEPVRKLREISPFLKYKDFMCSKEEYIEKNKYNRFMTFAVVKDRKWYERGEMGWWGLASNEKEQGTWEEEFIDIWDSIDDDEWISAVDCHI